MAEPEIIYVHPLILDKMKAEVRAENLKDRPQNIKLEDVMLIRSRGSRIVKPENISFED